MEIDANVHVFPILQLERRRLCNPAKKVTCSLIALVQRKILFYGIKDDLMLYYILHVLNSFSKCNCNTRNPQILIF